MVTLLGSCSIVAQACNFARWFVNTAGKAADNMPELEVNDAAGELVRIQGIRNVEGLLPDGTPVALKSAIVTDFPADAEQTKVGGLINPQLLAH